MAPGFLELLGASDRELVLRGANRVSYPRGAVAHAGVDGRQLSVVIESGLIRMFVASEDGRQASVMYLHRSDTYAVLKALNMASGASLQAVEASTVWQLDPGHVGPLATSNLAVSVAALQTAGRELSHMVRIITVRSLGTMTERLAFDLLERGCEAQIAAGELEIAATHEELADSIGSSREVVTRLLGDLRRRGCVATAPGRIRVINPVRLSLLVRGLVGD